jgi:hypothetical protein
MMRRWRRSRGREGELLRHQINNPVCNENVQDTADRKMVKIAHPQKVIPETVNHDFAAAKPRVDLEYFSISLPVWSVQQYLQHRNRIQGSLY